MEGPSLILAKLLLVTILVLGFGAQQLWSLRKANRLAARERAARDRAGRDDGPDAPAA